MKRAIEQVDVERIISLRDAVLCFGIARVSPKFEGDHEPTTIHLAMLEEHEVIACATLVQRDMSLHGDDTVQPARQLRGMAVTPRYQRQGLGKQLHETIIHRHLDLAEDDHRILWCNARTVAEPFYQKLGWRRLGEPFDIEDVGPHVKMLYTGRT